MPAGFYCPRPGCNWEGLAMPQGQGCPRCRHAVEAYTPSGAHPKPKAPESAPRDQSESTNYVLDEKAWKAATDDAGKVLGAAYKRHLYERYLAFGEKLARLLAEKQIAYGASFKHTRKVLAILYPNGVSVEQYGDLLTITRIIDKLFRVANQKGYGGESPYEDIVGYATLAACEDEEGVASTPNNKDQEPIDLAGGR